MRQLYFSHWSLSSLSRFHGCYDNPALMCKARTICHLLFYLQIFLSQTRRRFILQAHYPPHTLFPNLWHCILINISWAVPYENWPLWIYVTSRFPTSTSTPTYQVTTFPTYKALDTHQITSVKHRREELHLTHERSRIPKCHWRWYMNVFLPSSDCGED